MTSTNGNPASLHAQLRDLTDRSEIRDLLDRYVITLDTHDERQCDDDWYRTIFTDDVRLVFPIGSYDGVAGLADFETEAKAKWTYTHHISSNCAITLDGDRATLRAHLIGTHVHLRSERKPAEPPPAHFVVGAYYDADVVRTVVGWRFNRLALNVVWTAGEGLTGPEVARPVASLT